MAPTIPTIYKQHRLESWDEFLKIITGSPYSNWAFRGHRKEAWPLASALSRYFHNFHARRALRIWPVYVLVLVVVYLEAPWFIGQPVSMAIKTAPWLAYIFFV